MRLSHARPAVSVRFDDPNLVSCAGLTVMLALAARCGLAALVADRVHIAAKGGANAAAKIMVLVAGMVAGANCIDNMDLLRHGGMGRLFTDVRAPFTLGTFLRLFGFGHVRQLDAVAARVLARLAAATPILAGARSWRWSTSMTRCRRSMGMPSRASVAAAPGSRASTHC